MPKHNIEARLHYALNFRIFKTSQTFFIFPVLKCISKEKQHQTLFSFLPIDIVKTTIKKGLTRATPIMHLLMPPEEVTKWQAYIGTVHLTTNSSFQQWHRSAIIKYKIKLPLISSHIGKDGFNLSQTK